MDSLARHHRVYFVAERGTVDIWVNKPSFVWVSNGAYIAPVGRDIADVTVLVVSWICSCSANLTAMSNVNL